MGRWLTEHGQDVRVLHSISGNVTECQPCKISRTAKSRSFRPPTWPHGVWTSRTSCVINYDVPQHSEDHAHRITGPEELERKGKPLPFASQRNCLWFNRSRHHWATHCRIVDDFSYRDSPAEMVPTGAAVSKNETAVSANKFLSFARRR